MTILTDYSIKLPPLSDRLQAVASMVKRGETVADIGCDHGYISIWLYLAGVSPHCIASDIKEGPSKIAERNIELFDASAGVSVRTGPGLTVLDPGDADTAVIAGMGGRTIMDILSDSPDMSRKMHLILSPQSEADEVRRFLSENMFSIDEESFVKDDGKYYPVIRASFAGEVIAADDVCVMFGPRLLEEKNPVLKEYILSRRERIISMLDLLSEKCTVRSIERQKELEHELELIGRALDYYE